MSKFENDEIEDVFGERIVFELPKKGERLFTGTSNYYQFAHFGWGLKSQFYGYIKGYKSVSDAAVDLAVNSKDIAKLDTYVFPIIFNYRQFLELSLKSLYLDYSDDEPKTRLETIKKVSHDLMKMWDKVEPILLSTNDGTDHKKMIAIVKSYVKQYHDMDEGSFNFRYPITKQMTPVFKKEERIDLVNLKQRIGELSNFFDGMDGALDDLKQRKADWEEIQREMQAEVEAEWRAEMEAEARANMEREYE